MDNSIYGKLFRVMKLFSLTLAAVLLGINVQAKTIQLTMQHMEQPPSRVEAMQVVVDKFIHVFPHRLKQGLESTSSKLYRLFLLPLGRLEGYNLLQEFSTRLPKK